MRLGYGNFEDQYMTGGMRNTTHVPLCFFELSHRSLRRSYPGLASSGLFFIPQLRRGVYDLEEGREAVTIYHQTDFYGKIEKRNAETSAAHENGSRIAYSKSTIQDDINYSSDK